MKLLMLILLAGAAMAADWPPSQSSAVPSADGYVAIPGVALAPTKETSYRAVFDATRAAAKPTELVPALNMAASELNALAAVGAALSKAKFAVVSTATQSKVFSRTRLIEPGLA